MQTSQTLFSAAFSMPDCYDNVQNCISFIYSAYFHSAFQSISQQKERMDLQNFHSAGRTGRKYGLVCDFFPVFCRIQRRRKYCRTGKICFIQSDYVSVALAENFH